ncbi:MAG: hypothetical protein P8Y70_09250, partial [Candidatus Lokiarchaeota archaeon]
MNIPIELIYRYPWLPSLEDYFNEIKSKHPFDFISDVFSDGSNEISDYISNIFEAAFNNIEYYPLPDSDESNIYIYLIIRILLYLLNKDIISNRVANLYSKVTYGNLIEEDVSYIYDICQDLGISIRYYEIPARFGLRVHNTQREVLETNFSIHYVDYLRLAIELRDEHRRLINNPLSEGYVFIKKDQLVRLIQEYVRKRIKISQSNDSNNIENLKSKLFQIDKFKKLYDKILQDWDNIKEHLEYSFDFTYSSDIETEQIFPPCIKEILQKLQNGVNLGHTERLFLV